MMLYEMDYVYLLPYYAKTIPFVVYYYICEGENDKTDLEQLMPNNIASPNNTLPK